MNRMDHVSYAALALALGGVSPACAQEVRGPESPAQTSSPPSPAATASVSPPARDAAETQLGQIVVTARKVAENMQRVPVAVTAYSGAQLQQQNAASVPDIAKLTPGLSMREGTSTPSASSITIRGQVQTDILATLDPSVGTYVDGMYWARAYGINGDLLDIQSVQTLRGPQGTLFGRNTTGGAILIQTNDPNFNGFSGLVSATYGRFNQRGGTAILNVPIIPDVLAVRGAFTINKRDGYIDDLLSDRKLGDRNSWTGRGKLLFKPADNFSILLSGEIFRTKTLPRPYQLSQFTPTVFSAGGVPIDGLGALSAGVGAGNPAGGNALMQAAIDATRGKDAVDNDALSTNYTKTQTYNATATLDTFFGALKFIGGYRKVRLYTPLDLDGTPYQLLQTLSDTHLQQYSGEVQATGKAFGGAVDFAAGVFYFHESGTDQSTSSAIVGINPNNPTIYEGYIRNNSLGMYGQASWHITDRLTFTGGLRYSVDDKGLTVHNRAFVAAAGSVQCLIADAVLPRCSATRKDSFQGVSYTAGLDYRLTDSILIYTKSSKGFRSGGENLRASGLAASTFLPFKPEIAYSQEGGIKSEFFDRRLRVNLAGYYTKVDDIQRSVFVATPTGTATILGNAGTARFWGGEAEIMAVPLRGLELSATGSVTRPKYLKYFDALTNTDRRHDRFESIPRETFSVSAAYTHDVGIGRLYLRGDYIWSAKYYLGPFNDPTNPYNKAIIKASTAPAAGIINARASLTMMDDALELAVWGRNLTNNRSVDAGLLVPQPLSWVVTMRREPRTFGFTGTYKFGHF